MMTNQVMRDYFEVETEESLQRADELIANLEPVVNRIKRHKEYKSVIADYEEAQMMAVKLESKLSDLYMNVCDINIEIEKEEEDDHARRGSEQQSKATCNKATEAARSKADKTKGRN